MEPQKTRYWLILVVTLAVVLAITGIMASASSIQPTQDVHRSSRLPDEAVPAMPPAQPVQTEPPAPDAATSSQSPSRLSGGTLKSPQRAVDTRARQRAPDAAGDLIEVFTNTWSYSTIGLVYDPGRDMVRYAHESQSSTHNPTVYDADYVITHPLIYSFSLSAQNSGWPWQLDNCTGAGYDFVEDTYFLPDYNGDLSYADDNIVEVDVDGNILNAWEMDDEVGSNDSSDGSEIDSIIDIAVVPGSSPRYFATAAYDDNVVYEIALTKTGSQWTPNTWHTVATCTIPLWSATNDNLGIDYDAENERLYHSSWDTTTLVLTDLTCANGQPMNLATDDSGAPIQPFDCPGAGGYNSGVTFIEGSSPPEVWVTDFSSDQTTRCEAPGGEPPPATGWAKWVEGQPWDPDGIVKTQTLEVITVTDVITALEAFTLTETWDPDHLSLIGLDIFPPLGQVITQVGSLDFIGPAGPPEVVTVSKWFRVEPCDWVTTTLEERLVVENEPPFDETRPVTIVKQSPELWISSAYEPEVLAGGVASFTLSYGNLGGFENDVWISNSFPITTPFIYAEPFPDDLGPEGRWARWDVGDLAQNDADSIDVYVFVSETIPVSNTATIWDGIFNHLDLLQGETWISLHITDTLPPINWEKWINDEPWHPGISVTLETSQTLTVKEYIDPLGNPTGFSLLEEWNPDELALSSWTIEPADYNLYVETPRDDIWVLFVPPTIDFGPLTVTKEFLLRPCIWPETFLWEALQIGANPIRPRPVLVNKRPPELWIDSFFDVSVYSGEEATFTLAYSNTGGFESLAWIENNFPPEAPFVRSTPTPTERLEGAWAKWELGELGNNDRGTITVTVEIIPGLPPSTTIEIWDGIYNHVGEIVDDAVIAYHVPPPQWKKWVNGQAWNPDLGVLVQTADTFTVTDVISTRSAVAIVEHWNPERLALEAYDTQPDAGIILSDTGSLSWEFPGGAPGTVTITKWFAAEPCTWTYTVLWEELWMEDVEWERRPVHVDKFPPLLHLESAGGGEVYAGQEAVFTLFYSNAGGYENDAWITNTFPISAPFVTASLTPTRVADDGTWAAWRLGDLETDEEGVIDVTVAITESLVESDTLEIWDGIFHDRNWLITETVILYHVAQPPYTWAKEIDGTGWREGVSVTVETSDTIEVTDVISTAGLFELVEHWNPDELALVDWIFDPPAGEWFTETGMFVWHAPAAGPGRPQTVTLTKRFHVEPCTWPETILEEQLQVQGMEAPLRAVRLEKLAPDLWLESERASPEVLAGQQATFTLTYGNDGGREYGAWITNTFPISAPFHASEPVDPSDQAADGSWAVWDLDALETNEKGRITVTVEITEELPPDTPIHVYDYIYDHAGVERDWTVITYHVVAPPVPPVEPVWVKEIWINEQGPLAPKESPFTVVPSDTVTVVDRVWVTSSEGVSFTLVEEWTASLDFVGQEHSAGEVQGGNGDLRWLNGSATANTWHVLTKTFEVAAGEWQTGRLTETLTIAQVEPTALVPVILSFERKEPGEQYIYLPLALKSSN